MKESTAGAAPPPEELLSQHKGNSKVTIQN